MSEVDAAIKAFETARLIVPRSGELRTWRIEPMRSGVEGTISVVMPTAHVKFVAAWMGAPIGENYILWRKWNAVSLDAVEEAIQDAADRLKEQSDYMLGLRPVPTASQNETESPARALTDEGTK